MMRCSAFSNDIPSSPPSRRNHEWFQQDLPVYLFPEPTEQDSSIIDQDVVADICAKFNVSPDEVGLVCRPS